MATFKIDTVHSEIGFKVKHLMISSASGVFKTFDATVDAEKEDFSDAKINFEADVASIDSKNVQRDEHLKSEDFFNAEKFPKLTFVSKSISKKSDVEFELRGDLTIRDVTKEVDLDVEYNGTVKDPWGQLKAGFEINGKISRNDFGLKWSAVTEAGGLVVGDEIKLHMNIEMQKN